MVGCGSKVAALILILGAGMWRKLDEVLLAVVLELVGDAMSVCIFAPSLPFAPAPVFPSSWPTRRGQMFGAPPHSLFARGRFTLSQRIGCLCERGGLLFFLSLSICLIGQACCGVLEALRTASDAAKCAAQTLTNARRSRDKNISASTAEAYNKGRGEGEGERGGGGGGERGGGEGDRGGGGGGVGGCRDQTAHIQNIKHTHNTKLTQNTKYIYVPRISEALSFAVFMATSGNFRLHLVAAAEERLVDSNVVVQHGLEVFLVILLRFLNCCTGGVSWLAYRHLLMTLFGGYGGRERGGVVV